MELNQIDNNRKSCSYWLKMEKQQNKNFMNDKNINMFVDDATKNINLSERQAMYCILKYVIVNTSYTKQDIIDNISEMFKNEKIEPIINASPLNKQILKKFQNLNESDRKVLIGALVDNLNKLDFNRLNNEENSNLGIDKDINKAEKEQENIYIEYNFNDNNKRLLYIYDDGTIIAINVEKKQCLSRIKKRKVSEVMFIKKFLKNNTSDINNKENSIIIDIDGKIIFKNKYIFYILTLLLQEKKKIQNKIFFDYEDFFNTTFKYEIDSLHREQKEELFIFYEWCPNETEISGIVEECQNITGKIDIEVKDNDIKELYYFANHYKKNKDYIKAIQFFEKIAQNGIDYANGEIAYIYNQMKNKQKEEEYLNKINDLINIYKKITAKKCYEIQVPKNERISCITDSSMHGTPYIPIGEEYPYSKDGKPLKLLIQINLRDIKLEGYPQKGILQIYVEPDSREPEYQIKYYEDITLLYQKDLPEAKELELWNFAQANSKIIFKESITYMPLTDERIETALKRAIKEYNQLIGINLIKYNEDDLDNSDLLWYIIDKKIKNYPLLLGGYADYWNIEHYTSKESLLKLMSDYETSVNVLISCKEIEKKDFNKAEIVFDS